MMRQILKNASLAQKVLESQKKYQEKYQSTSTNPDTTNKNSQEQENAEKTTSQERSTDKCLIPSGSFLIGSILSFTNANL